MTYFMGIDGGGSTLRVVITDENMQSLVQVTRGSANPNLIGRETALSLVQDAMREAYSHLPNISIDAVGIGIAGATVAHAEDWLHEIVCGVFPETNIAAASDYKIALVGATGERRGLLILAGTGSVIFGINASGDELQIGGWGSILGDEGSGFWIGKRALQRVTTDYDKGALSNFSQQILDHLAITDARHVIDYVYQDETPVPTIARLAPVVLQLADDGNRIAQGIITDAAQALTDQARIAIERLALHDPQIAFAGSLLTQSNALQHQLCQQWNLPAPPEPIHSPVIGAALLAKLSLANSHR